MARGTAIYLSETRALAVQLEGSAKAPRIRRAVTLDFEPPAPAEDGKPPAEDELLKAKAGQLKAWLKSNALLGNNVALCIDNSDVILRELRLAFTERKQIDKVVAFQVESLIPSTPIEDLAVTYMQLVVREAESDLLVAAGRKAAVRPRMALLKAAGVVPMQADAALFGTLNLRTFVPELADVKTPTAWIDFQGEHALICVLEGSTIVSVRSMLIPDPVAGELTAVRGADVVVVDDDGWVDVEEGEAQQPGWDYYEEGKDNTFHLVSGTPASESTVATSSATGTSDSLSSAPTFSEPLDAATAATSVAAALSPAPDPAAKVTPSRPLRINALKHMLGFELRRAMVTSHLSAPIARVLITGLPKKLETAFEALGAEIGADVSVHDMLEPLVLRDRSGTPKVTLPVDPMLASLTGVALKAIGHDVTRTDLLVGDLSPVDAFDEVKNPLAVGATLLFMFAGIALMIVLQQRNELIKHRQDLVEGYRLREAFEMAYAEAPPAIREARSFPGSGSPGSSVIDAHKIMKGDIELIGKGNRANLPPQVDALDVYIKVLGVIDATFKDKETGVPRDFALESFTLSQENNLSGKTTGKLTLKCFLEDTASSKFRNALAALTIADPTRQSDAPVPLFERVDMTPGSTKIIDRGKVLVGTREETVRIRDHTLTCTLATFDLPEADKNTRR